MTKKKFKTRHVDDRRWDDEQLSSNVVHDDYMRAKHHKRFERSLKKMNVQDIEDLMDEFGDSVL